MMTPVNDRYEDDRTISLLAKDQYLREVAWTNILSKEEESMLLRCVDLAKQMPSDASVQNAAKQARDRLVEAYQPLVLKIARRFVSKRRSMDLLDLVQEGSIGLMMAIENYDASRCIFHSHAAFEVLGALCTACRDSDGMVRLTEVAVNSIRKVLRMQKHLCVVLGRDASMAELASELGLSVERVYEVLSWRACSRAESLEELIGDDRPEDYTDFPSLFSGFVSEDYDKKHLQASLQQAVDALPDLQGQVLRLRYGLTEDDDLQRTYQEIAEVLGKFKSCVSSSGRRAVERLREMMDVESFSHNAPCEMRSVYGNEYYTVNEVSNLLGVTNTCVCQYARSGRLLAEARMIKTRKLWVFPKHAIDDLVAQSCQVVG